MSNAGRTAVLTLGRLAIVAAMVLGLAAIWITAHWWQLLLSALLALVIGAAILGTPSPKPPRRGHDLMRSDWPI
jgi:predicted membrane metal-binding protein